MLSVFDGLMAKTLLNYCPFFHLLKLGSASDIMKIKQKQIESKKNRFEFQKKIVSKKVDITFTQIF